MSKKGKETDTEVAVLEKEDSGVPVIKDNGNATVALDTKELSNMLETTEFKHSLKVTGEYFNPEVGEEVLAAFIGKTRIIGMTGEEVPAVRLLLKDEKIVVTASAIINSALSNCQAPTPVKIVKTGERKAKVGVLNVFEVWILS